MNQPLPFHDHAMDAATAFQAAGAAGLRQGLEAPRQDVREQHRAHPRRHREVRGRGRAQRRQVEEGLGRPEDQGRGRRGSEDRRPPPAPAGRRRSSSTAASWSARSESSAFEKIIDDEIKEADALLKKGTPLKDVYTKRIETAALAAPARRRPAPADDPGGKFRRQARRRAGQGARLGAGHGGGLQRLPVPVLLARGPDAQGRSRTAYKGKVRIAFKQLPLPFHDKAHLAAEAALAANEQGKFWQMHDKLFANQQALDRPSLEKYAQELGLDMGKFKAALDSGKFKDKVDAEDKEGAAVGATGTPDLLHQRHQPRRRPAVRRLQGRHRQRAQGQQGLGRRPQA